MDELSQKNIGLSTSNRNPKSTNDETPKRKREIPTNKRDSTHLRKSTTRLPIRHNARHYSTKSE